MTIQDEYNKLIEKFKLDCDEHDDWVFNKNLIGVNIAKVKHILVADNPGDREKKHEVYLYAEDNKENTAGKIAADFCKNFLESDSILVLNKCPISTTSSADLKKLPYYKSESYKNALEYMAQLIYDVNELAPQSLVMIFGTTGTFDAEHKLSEKGLWYHFYEKLRKLYKGDKSKPILVKHFCRNLFIRDFLLKDEAIVVCTDSTERKNLTEKHGYAKVAKANLVTIDKKALMEAFKKLPYSGYLFS